MIETFFGTDRLVTEPTPATFLAALVIGLFFGFALERAGFGSSRKLAGIFYFTDMTVLRVMFTALITAMLGLSLVVGLGWIDLESQVYLIPTMYWAQIVGGLVFGVGFVLGGWCPGTAAVGAASGKVDAFLFLAGAVLGTILFNVTQGWVSPLQEKAEVEVAFGMSRNVFALLFTLVAIGAFYFAEWIEKTVAGGGRYLQSTFLQGLSVVLLIVAVAVAILPESETAAAGGPGEAALLAAVEAGEDHIEPEELAELLINAEDEILLVDIRDRWEFDKFHIRGAVHIPMSELPDSLSAHKNRGRIVLYSNGMTHPAQARDALARQGYDNVFLLTDGLQGFVDRCLKPVSLRDIPLREPQAARVRTWRGHFLGD